MSVMCDVQAFFFFVCDSWAAAQLGQNSSWAAAQLRPHFLISSWAEHFSSWAANWLKISVGPKIFPVGPRPKWLKITVGPKNFSVGPVGPVVAKKKSLLVSKKFLEQ